MGQKFADGAGVRSVKHCTRMASRGASGNAPAMMMPAMGVAMVTVAPGAAIMMRC